MSLPFAICVSIKTEINDPTVTNVKERLHRFNVESYNSERGQLVGRMTQRGKFSVVFIHNLQSVSSHVSSDWKEKLEANPQMKTKLFEYITVGVVLYSADFLFGHLSLVTNI